MSARGSRERRVLFSRRYNQPSESSFDVMRCVKVSSACGLRNLELSLALYLGSILSGHLLIAKNAGSNLAPKNFESKSLAMCIHMAKI